MLLNWAVMDPEDGSALARYGAQRNAVVAFWRFGVVSLFASPEDGSALARYAAQRNAVVGWRILANNPHICVRGVRRTAVH